MRFVFLDVGRKPSKNSSVAVRNNFVVEVPSPTSVTTATLYQNTIPSAVNTSPMERPRMRKRGSKDSNAMTASASHIHTHQTSNITNSPHHFNNSSQYLAHVKQEQDEHSMSSISSISEASVDKEGGDGGNETYRKQLDAMMSNSSPYSIIEELHQEEVKRNQQKRRSNGPSPTSVMKNAPFKALADSHHMDEDYDLHPYSKLESDPLSEMQSHSHSNAILPSGQREYVIPSFDLPEDAWTIQGIATEVTGTTGTGTAATEGAQSMYTGYTDGTGVTCKHKNGIVAMTQKKQRDKYHPCDGNKDGMYGSGNGNRGIRVSARGDGSNLHQGNDISQGKSGSGNDVLVFPHTIDIQQGADAIQHSNYSHERAFIKVTKLKGPGTGTVACGNISVVGSTASSATSMDRSMAPGSIIDDSSHSHRRQFEEAGYLKVSSARGDHQNSGPLGKLFFNFFQCCSIETVAEEDELGLNLGSDDEDEEDSDDSNENHNHSRE